jgi:broad specificity phosphatase PhoE
MKIYIVRHGEVKHNLLKIYSTEDEKLDNKGIKQANKLKDKISN